MVRCAWFGTFEWIDDVSWVGADAICLATPDVYLEFSGWKSEQDIGHKRQASFMVGIENMWGKGRRLFPTRSRPRFQSVPVERESAPCLLRSRNSFVNVELRSTCPFFFFSFLDSLCRDCFP